MKLSKGVKILIGLGTVWEVIYPFLFIVLWLMMVGSIFFFSGNSDQGWPVFSVFSGLFAIIFPVHCFAIVLQFGLIAVYLIHVIKNTAASETVRIILGIGIFFMPFVAMPVYYYVYIWREAPPAWAVAKPPSPVQVSGG